MEMGGGGWSPEIFRKESGEGDWTVGWVWREAGELLSSRDKWLHGGRKESTLRGAVGSGDEDDRFRSVQVALEASLKHPTVSVAIN